MASKNAEPDGDDITGRSELRQVYYWHVRAYDPDHCRAVVIHRPSRTGEPAGPRPPSPSGPAPNDAVNPNTVIIHNSPNVASWPVTTKLSRLDLMRARMPFSAQGNWPGIVPPGWSGGLQWTLWIVLNITGQWHTGLHRYWKGS